MFLALLMKRTGFETDVLTQPDNLAALMDLSAQWIDQVQQRRPTDRVPGQFGQ